MHIMAQDTYSVALKRSEEMNEQLTAGPANFRMLTGDRPTGRLHLGHYFGTLVERVRLQNMGVDTWVLVADFQVITDRQTTEHINDNVKNLIIDYLACGIDPNKSTIFCHSQIPELNELMLPFLSLVSEAELMRNPTVKAENEASSQPLSGLLLTYPVHQACDILFCKAHVVPVGKDQLPHIELTRNIAHRFNRRYAEIFNEPAGLLSQQPLLPGLDGRKMSKSYGNALTLSATEEQTAHLIKKAQTDSERLITFDPERRPGVSALLSTAALVTGRDEVSIAQEIGDAGAGALKAYVTESVNSFLAPIRERRQEIAKDSRLISEVLAAGNERARHVAQETLAELLDAMHMNYA